MEIKLRLLGIEDVDFMLMVENDPEVWSFSSLCDAPYTKEEIESFCTHYEHIDSVKNEEQLRYVIICENKKVGFIDLYNKKGKEAFLGIIIYPKQNRGNGIGKTAVATLKQTICKELGIEKLWVEVDRSNRDGLLFFKAIGNLIEIAK